MSAYLITFACAFVGGALQGLLWVRVMARIDAQVTAESARRRSA